MPAIRDAGLDQVLRVVAIQDGEVALVAQEAACERRTRAPMEWNVPPQSDAQFLAEQIGNAPHHFAGGLVREREEQNPVGRECPVPADTRRGR
jgi:hypothetical protein